MPINREKEPEKRRLLNQRGGGEPTYTPPSISVRTERPQQRLIRIDNPILKDELPFYQLAADSLTAAGLGIYHFTVAEQQVIPITGQPVGENSPFVIATYIGQENRDRLWDIIYGAKDIKQKMKQQRKSKEEIDQAVEEVIKTRVKLLLRLEAHSKAILDSIRR